MMCFCRTYSKVSLHLSATKTICAAGLVNNYCLLIKTKLLMFVIPMCNSILCLSGIYIMHNTRQKRVVVYIHKM